MPPDFCWWGTGASRVAVWGHSPCQPDFRAVSIAWILLFGARAGTSMARAAQASPPRPGGRFGFARLERHLAVVHGQQPVVGDGDTVGVASDIVEDLGWP